MYRHSQKKDEEEEEKKRKEKRKTYTDRNKQHATLYHKVASSFLKPRLPFAATLLEHAVALVPPSLPKPPAVAECRPAAKPKGKKKDGERKH